jgi:hypothetical protein
MRSRFWLILWIICILFPIALLGSLWHPFGRLFDIVFSPNWIHIAMHTFLYAVLAFMLAQWIKPVSLKAVMSILALAIVIGCLQEGLQGLAPGHGFSWSASAFDLFVDSVGTTIGLILARRLSLRRAGGPIDRQ